MSVGGQADVLLFDIAADSVALVDSTPDAEVAPAWSPDGSILSFGSDRGGSCAVYLYDLEAESSTPVSEPWSGDCNPSTAWSWSSGQLAFFRDGPRDVRLLDLERAEEVTLTEVIFPNGYMRWSPNGSTLAYREASDPTGWIELISVEEGAAGVFDGSLPRWSPASAW